MIRRPPRSTLLSSSAASDVYKRQHTHTHSHTHIHTHTHTHTHARAHTHTHTRFFANRGGPSLRPWGLPIIPWGLSLAQERGSRDRRPCLEFVPYLWLQQAHVAGQNKRKLSSITLLGQFTSLGVTASTRNFCGHTASTNNASLPSSPSPVRGNMGPWTVHGPRPV